MDIDREELVRLTEEYCGPWGIHHTRRLLQLIEIIGGMCLSLRLHSNRAVQG